VISLLHATLLAAQPAMSQPFSTVSSRESAVLCRQGSQDGVQRPLDGAHGSSMTVPAGGEPRSEDGVWPPHRVGLAACIKLYKDDQPSHCLIRWTLWWPPAVAESGLSELGTLA
jgi:hypothetical protein